MTRKTNCTICRGRGYKPTSAGGDAPVEKVPCQHCMEKLFMQEKRINSMGGVYYKTVVAWIPKKEFEIP